MLAKALQCYAVKSNDIYIFYLKFLLGVICLIKYIEQYGNWSFMKSRPGLYLF